MEQQKKLLIRGRCRIEIGLVSVSLSGLSFLLLIFF